MKNGSAGAGRFAVLRAGALGDKLNIALIGAGGKGAENLRGVEGENIAALCGASTARAIHFDMDLLSWSSANERLKRF